MKNTELITRLEVIGEDGRMLVLTDISVSVSIQDGGRTMKLFTKAKGNDLCPNCEKPTEATGEQCDSCNGLDEQMEGDYHLAQLTDYHKEF